ncbi:MAG: EAL domain-containing protein [Gammaproteobacteria bacterium]|nr:EAL domain-containing protein [Gammaproteobacteria bacterium]
MDDKIINILVIDDSFDSEELIVSKLRTAGFTARSSRAEDEEDLLEAVSTHTPDIILYFDNMESITLKDTVACLKKDKSTKDCRVIAVSKSQKPNVVNAMYSGAVDASSLIEIEHLILIIDREHRSLLNARQISKYKKEFEESEKRCTLLLDSSRDAIAYIHEGMHVYSNQSYLELFGIAEHGELEGLPILDMVAVNSRDDFKDFLRGYTRNEEGIKKLRSNLRKPGGEEFMGEMELSPARIEGEPCVQIVIRQQNLNSDELERQLKLLSQQDQLTGLYSLQYCIDSLEKTIKDAEEHKYTAALMEIHIDNFDEIKKTVGVVESNQYIVAAAKALNKAIHDSDVISRYTHESFLVIAVNSNKDNIERYAKEIQQSILHLEARVNETNINTTCCIGIALIDSDSPDYHELLVRSEKAVNAAMENGVNQVVTYIPKKGELTQHEIDAKLKEQLTSALTNDNFVLHYQPVISLYGDTTERYEVFVRLENNETFQLIMPHEFIPATERIGMAIAVDRWVLFRAIKEFVNRRAQGITTQFFIKLSAASLKDETLMDWLSYQVKEKQIPANTLNFEIKESVAVTNLKYAKILGQKLKTIGCNFVLDEFGTNANPFQLLDHVDVDYIRLHRSLMEGLLENTQNQETVKRLTERAQKLNKQIIAQHVPDAGSLSIIWGIGVNFVQGYFFQEPSPKMEYDFTEMSA